jgi:hypothetical protein
MFWLIKLNALRTAKTSGVSGLTIIIIVLHCRVFMAQVTNLSSYILLLLLNGRSCECWLRILAVLVSLRYQQNMSQREADTLPLPLHCKHLPYLAFLHSTQCHLSQIRSLSSALFYYLVSNSVTRCFCGCAATWRVSCLDSNRYCLQSLTCRNICLPVSGRRYSK